ncbi:MAG: family 2 glycosyl transferase [Syntrophomonas sp.]|nr:family 2 glycosyl transferase [Syntrophomonas sp.]
MSFKRTLTIMMVFLMLIAVSGCFKTDSSPKDVFQTEDKVKMVSKAEGEDILVYTNLAWKKSFWHGINLGATTPGHSPGELSPSYDDYRRWFNDIAALDVQVIRIYTILPPHFYQALVDHNQNADSKLWFIQGIWPPDEELIKKQNAYLTSITKSFKKEISLAVLAVYGQGKISPQAGKASGDYKANAAPYLLAWMAGAEWDPYAVNETNNKNPDMKQFNGKYFRTYTMASPFEVWLAEALDYLACEEMKLKWQHPISFVNWVTTDPLPHPDEPLIQEDFASVDPIHIAPTDDWKAGYFAAYHVYPYYPDSLRYQKDYQNYIGLNGEKDPYEAYLVQLRQHHAGIPFIIAEFGVPSSRGMAHRGPMNRNQGLHTEAEQGQQTISMFEAMKRAGVNGGILFEWHDEWFKFTWNTWDLEIPSDRRAMWYNRLTNEENFGILAVEPGRETVVILDGKKEDWDKNRYLNTVTLDDGSQLMATSDEGYLYIAIKRSKEWNLQQEKLIIGFDTVPGGNRNASQHNITFPQGVEFLLTFFDNQSANLQVASSYDQHTYLYGLQKKMIPFDPVWEIEDNGIFLPWKLCLSRELILPASQEVIPFEELEIGQLKAGTTDTDSPEYNSLADFYAGQNLMEIRIPWMMLGYTDPSSHQAWPYFYRYKIPRFFSTTSPGVHIYTVISDPADSDLLRVQSPLAYKWNSWNEPNYHERKKQSYYLLQSYFNNH